VSVERRLEKLETARREANHGAWVYLSRALSDYEQLHPRPHFEVSEEDDARMVAWRKTRPEFNEQDQDDAPEDDTGDTYSTPPGTPEEWHENAQSFECDAITLERLTSECPLPDAARELTRWMRWMVGWSEAGSQALERYANR
jgi:hypothetical protein